MYLLLFFRHFCFWKKRYLEGEQLCTMWKNLLRFFESLWSRTGGQLDSLKTHKSKDLSKYRVSVTQRLVDQFGQFELADPGRFQSNWLPRRTGVLLQAKLYKVCLTILVGKSLGILYKDTLKMFHILRFGLCCRQM